MNIFKILVKSTIRHTLIPSTTKNAEHELLHELSNDLRLWTYNFKLKT